MINGSRCHAAAFGMLALAAQPILAQGATAAPAARGVILGTVTDTSLRPVDEAQVAIVLTGAHVTADSRGRFQITEMPAGKFLVVVRRLGFQPISSAVEVRGGDTLRLAFTLERATPELGAVVVTEKSKSVRLKEFDERRKLGEGEFFTQQEIEKRNLVSVSDLLRHAKAVRLSPSGAAAYSAREFKACPMQVYLDGIPLQGRGPTSPPNLDDLPSPKEVMGIEVYAGAATLPVWLPNGPSGGKKGCGAILIWTRDGS